MNVMSEKVNIQDLINTLKFWKSEQKEITLEELENNWESINGFVDVTKLQIPPIKSEFQREGAAYDFVFSVIVTFGSKFPQDMFLITLRQSDNTLVEHELVRFILNELYQTYNVEKYLDIIKISTSFMLDHSNGIIEWMMETRGGAGYNDGKYYFNYHLSGIDE